MRRVVLALGVMLGTTGCALLDVFAEPPPPWVTVRGERSVAPPTAPIERILLSYFGNLYVRKVTGMPLTDTTAGFRCARREILLRSGVERSRSNGYAFQIELEYRLLRHGAHIVEIPFFFLDRTRGASKLTARIGLETLWMACWLRVADWLGRV